MKKIAGAFAVTAVSFLAISATAQAAPVEVPPVGTTFDMKCSGSGGAAGSFDATNTWKVVKNDGENYRFEADNGSYFEGPIRGFATPFRSAMKFASSPVTTQE